MNGGGGGRVGDDRETDRGGMITLEDLESFAEDQLSDSGNGSLEEEGEGMEEDDDRLLHYWQDVARGHQVEVAQGKKKKKHARPYVVRHTVRVVFCLYWKV